MDWLIVLLLLLAGGAASIWKKKLTFSAAVTGMVVGWLMWAGGGYTGLVMLAVFFVLGTAATSWKALQKIGFGKKVTYFPQQSDVCPSDNEPSVRSGLKGAAAQATRTMGQVIANGGVAALAGLGILCFPAARVGLELAMAGSISSAMADTLSSELGVVYGRRCFNILSFRRDQRGLDGVVSLEGLGIGVVGSVLIALLFVLGHGWNGGFWIIVLAGTLGNLMDSVLGAAFERRGWVGNDMVNFLNTLFAGLAAGFLALAQ